MSCQLMSTVYMKQDHKAFQCFLDHQSYSLPAGQVVFLTRLLQHLNLGRCCISEPCIVCCFHHKPLLEKCCGTLYQFILHLASVQYYDVKLRHGHNVFQKSSQLHIALGINPQNCESPICLSGYFSLTDPYSSLRL